MLNKLLLAVLFLEVLDEARVPELTDDSEILASAHQGIRFATFSCSGNTAWVKVVLFATSNRNEAKVWLALKHKSGSTTTHRPLQTRAYSLVTVFSVTM